MGWVAESSSRGGDSNGNVGSGRGWLGVTAAEGGGAGGGQSRAGAVAAEQQVGGSRRAGMGERQLIEILS